WRTCRSCPRASLRASAGRARRPAMIAAPRACLPSSPPDRVPPMLLPGPPLETLLRRLADTPPDFLDDPRIGATGQVVVAAVVNALLAQGPGRASLDELQRFEGRAADAGRLRMALLMAWLLADDTLRGHLSSRPEMLKLLDGTAAELAGLAPAARYLHDPDRR